MSQPGSTPVRTDGARLARGALGQAWERTLVRRAGDRAVVEAATGRTCTFAELDALAVAWLDRHEVAAAGLRQRAVVVAGPNSIDWLAVFLGLLRAGAVVVPVDGSEPAATQRHIGERLRAAYWYHGDKLVALAGARRFRDPAACLIKLTSGTTGDPRPLVFTAAQMLADARQVTGSMGIHDRDLNYALIPFGHSYGLGNLTLPLIAHGVPLVCGSAPLPQAIAAEFERWQPSVFPTVPAVYRALVASDVGATAFASLRLAISAGAALPPEVARDFRGRFGRTIHNFYGSSETGGIAYDKTGVATLAGGVGTRLRGVGIKPLRSGRIEICSPAVFSHGNPRRCSRQGCWVPADCATLDSRGQLRLLGRRGSTVKLGARRLNVAEVVAALRRLSGVRDAWIGLAGGVEPVLGAAVATERKPAELRAGLLTSVAPWKIPKRWAIMRELPVTPRGKLDRRVLQKAVFGA